MNQQTILVVQTLSKLAIIGKIEDVLQSLYAYFSHSLKRTQKFVEMADIVETRGQCILKNIKTRWNSMLLPTKRVLSEYKALILKMH